MTGRPSITYPYTKNLILGITGGLANLKHKASIFVEGLYSNGKGQSFALPTDLPIMIHV